MYDSYASYHISSPEVAQSQRRMPTVSDMLELNAKACCYTMTCRATVQTPRGALHCRGGKAMKRRIIMIPLDGSALSRAIIPHIPRLFDPEAHSLVLFRVAELPAGITSAPPWPMASTWALPTHITARDFERARFPIYASQEEQSARDALECELGEAARPLEAAGYQVTIAVRFGDPAEEIATFVKAAHVDLVAMATHGRTGIRHLVLGSVAEQLLRTLDVPVFLVRPRDDTNDDTVVTSGHRQNFRGSAV